MDLFGRCNTKEGAMKTKQPGLVELSRTEVRAFFSHRLLQQALYFDAREQPTVTRSGSGGLLGRPGIDEGDDRIFDVAVRGN
jgi:hypothetical protein